MNYGEVLYSGQMSARKGRGISKEELREILADGYSMNPEDLDPPPAVRHDSPSQRTYSPLEKYDAESVSQSAAKPMAGLLGKAHEGVVARWPEWRQRLGKTLDGHRLRHKGWEAKDWDRLLDEISDEDWETIWQCHQWGPNVAKTYCDWKAKQTGEPAFEPFTSIIEIMVEWLGDREEILVGRGALHAQFGETVLAYREYDVCDPEEIPEGWEKAPLELLSTDMAASHMVFELMQRGHFAGMEC